MAIPLGSSVIRDSVIRGCVGAAVVTIVGASAATAQRASRSGLTEQRGYAVWMLAASSAMHTGEANPPAVDSTSTDSHAGTIALGGLVGAVVGFELGGRLAGRHHQCSDCAIPSAVLNRGFLLGTIAGTVSGAAIAWWLFGRD